MNVRRSLHRAQRLQLRVSSGTSTSRAATGVAGRSSHPMLRAQARIGNQGVLRMLGVKAAGHARLTAPGLTGVLQRHTAFRASKTLETQVLATPELQKAASSAGFALEVGKSSGDSVERLQRALTTAGHPVPITSTYDAATQTAVAGFQSEHGIPFPTGRQSGPKTLATLDDHLLSTSPPRPSPNPACNAYAPNERTASLRSRGLVRRTGALGQELRLFNFGAAQGRMKPEHEAAVKQFIKDFDLFDPEAQFQVEFVRGFTDAVPPVPIIPETTSRVRLV